MRVLIAEDDLISRRLLEATLGKWGYQVISVTDGAAAWEALQAEDAPRLAILDWMMPGIDGVDVCARVRQRRAPAYQYLLLLTARDRRQDIIEGLEAGADDYLIKPVDAAELRARLGAGRRILKLQDDLMAANDRLHHQATHDPLTDLWNHGAILEILAKELTRGQRDGKPVSVIMADLDHFKQINDTHGHQAGDAVLKAAAARLQSLLRPYDSLGRYGGEEFLLVLPGCDAAGVAGLGQRLCAAVAGQPVPLGESPVAITISGGTVTAEATETARPEWLLRAADAALYRAKRHGRNRIEPSGPEDRQPGKGEEP